MGPLDAVLDPFGQPEFADGVRAGMVAVLAVGALGAVFRRVGGRPAPVAGLGLAGAALVAMRATLTVPDEVLLGVGLCALAGLLADLVAASPVVTAVAATPGAVLIASTPGVDVAGAGSFRPLAVAVAAAAGGALVAAFDRRWRHVAWGPALVAVTAGGIYSTVPDTELALALFGASVAIALAGWPLRLAHLGGAGSMAVVAVLAWSVAAGGVGRDGSVVGGLACLGLLVVDPAVRSLGERSPLRHVPEPWRLPVVGGTHVVVVLWMARVAGLREGAGPAAVLVTAGFVVATVAWAAAGRASRATR